MILKTSLKFPCINSFLASSSPCLIYCINLFFSSIDNIGNLAVFTPEISTLFMIKTPLDYNLLISLFPKGVLTIRLSFDLIRQFLIGPSVGGLKLS